MDALQRINRELGITVFCNLHSLELARNYCGRLIGMAAGGVVFDGTPEQLTQAEAQRLYGLESETKADPAVMPSGAAVQDSVQGMPAVA